MNGFSQAFASVWPASVTIFGDKCTLNNTEYDCVIHILQASDGVVQNRAGRSENVVGTVIMKYADWVSAGGRKGHRILLPGGEFRIVNKPDVGYGSDTVELSIEALT